MYAALCFQAIDADLNMLSHLPLAFGELQLRSLKLSYNRLESLRDDLFLPKLKETLGQLWLSNNNLLELPDSLVEVIHSSSCVTPCPQSCIDSSLVLYRLDLR